MIAAIVAVDEHWGIGFNGQLLESIPEDLKHFRELTITCPIIMGSNTWRSLPNKPLPHRLNVVISHNINKNSTNPLYMKMDLVKEWLLSSEKDIFIIGGGQIYKELLPLCNRVYVTKIYKSHDNVDTYFPNLDELKYEWEVSSEGKILTFHNFHYQFVVYDRIS